MEKVLNALKESYSDLLVEYKRIKRNKKIL